MRISRNKSWRKSRKGRLIRRTRRRRIRTTSSRIRNSKRINNNSSRLSSLNRSMSNSNSRKDLRLSIPRILVGSSILCLMYLRRKRIKREELSQRKIKRRIKNIQRTDGIHSLDKRDELQKMIHGKISFFCQDSYFIDIAE